MLHYLCSFISTKIVFFFNHSHIHMYVLFCQRLLASIIPFLECKFLFLIKLSLLMLHVQHTTLAKSSMITPVLLLLHSWNQILLFQCTYNKHTLLFPLWLFEDYKSFLLKVGITFVFWMGERSGEGKRGETVRCFTIQIATTTKVLGLYPGLPYGWQRSKHLCHPPLFS